MAYYGADKDKFKSENGENPNAWVLTFVIFFIIIMVALVIYGIYKMTVWLWKYTQNVYITLSWVIINMAYWGYWFHLNFHLLPPKSPWSGGPIMPGYIIAIVFYVILLLVAIGNKSDEPPESQRYAITDDDDDDDDIEYAEIVDNDDNDDAKNKNHENAIRLAIMGYGLKKSYDLGRKLGK